MLYQTLKKNQRDEQILLSLDDMTYATRKQLQIVNGLGGDRNAQRILQRMEKEGLIKSVRYETKVYYISNKGKQQIGGNKKELNKSQIVHCLMRNDLFIKLGMPKGWIKEQPITWDGKRLIPDATYKNTGEFHFVEIDHRQVMATNVEKIKKYKDLSNLIAMNYNHKPTVIWYSLSETRKKRLKAECEKAGIKFIIY